MSQHFEIEYYTDPLCCWSWGMEPQMRKLRYLLRDRISYRYVMGGMLRDWKHFSDPMNNIEHPSQTGPLWMEAKHTSGQPMNEAIWIDDPVDTSYLACLAVKAAEIRSRKAGEALLRKLREAVMMHKKNIGQKDIILEIARGLHDQNILNYEDFREDFCSDEAADLFREDLHLVKVKNISRFPTLLISYRGRTLQITGYRPFPVLLDAFRALDPGLQLDEEIEEEAYRSSWESLTARELREVQKQGMEVNS